MAPSAIKTIKMNFEDIDGKNGWHLHHSKITRTCLGFQLTTEEARKPENKALNRYRDVVPYDDTRVILRRNNLNYINANFVSIPKAHTKYILTQGPLPATCSHFWLMIWEQETHAIIMLNKLIEKNDLKCHPYWPEGKGSKKYSFTDIDLEVELLDVKNHDFFLKRTLRICDLQTGDSREVIQFHYETWADFGVPESTHQFLCFLKHVRNSGLLEPDYGPAVVHCSAGIGRSGTFCMIDTCLILSELYPEEDIDFNSILYDMRKQRMGLVQSPMQLKFCYMAIIQGVKLNFSTMDIEDFTNYGIQSQRKNSRSSSSSVESYDQPPTPPPRIGSLEQSRCKNNVANIEIKQENVKDDKKTESPISVPEVTATVNGNECKKRKLENGNDWISSKRFLNKPNMLTVAIVLCSIVVYACFKN